MPGWSIMENLEGEKKISACNHLIQCFHTRKMVFPAETQALLDAESWALPTSRLLLRGAGGTPLHHHPRGGSR